MASFEVRAHWDPEVHVWWAESDDVPGLVAEAESEENMRAELRELVPELLRVNGAFPADGRIQLHFVFDETEDLIAA